MTTTTAQIQKTIARIALEHCGFETLDERRSDRLDFREVAVWSMKAALEAAYLAGRAAQDDYTESQKPPATRGKRNLARG